MEFSRFPLESDIVETKDHELFDVIGMDHPLDRVIAYPRYVPSDNVTERQRFGQNPIQYYQKLEDLSARIAWIEKMHPEYILKHSRYDIEFCAVPHNTIIHHWQPDIEVPQLERELQNLDVNHALHSLYSDAIDFVHFLAQTAHVPIHYFGITGSLLSRLATPQSDLDITVYGFMNGLRVRDVLRSIFQDESNISDLRRYTRDELKKLYAIRACGTEISFFDFLKYEFRKLHQGTFRHRDFFIRYFEHPTREEYARINRFDRQKIRCLGRVIINSEVRGDEFWWTTPARLELANTQILSQNLDPGAEILLDQYHLKPNQVTRTFTLRGRMIENARLLELITAHGTLELVIPDNATPYLQLALGANPTDYLKQR
jgi:predicted nucleotidyltransferase